MKEIFSPGKLLLTSEYVVLDGALALAVPTKWGQDFLVEEINNQKSIVSWNALHQGKTWLQIQIDYSSESIVSTNLPAEAEFINKILRYVKKQSALQLKGNVSYHITTNLQFPADYGLGSSSTLMNNIATWAQIDAFELNENCLGGSGYDIAVAQQNSAILYKNQPSRTVQKITFQPEYIDELILIHLNKKQNSRSGIELYRKSSKSPAIINEFSEITHKVLGCQSLQEFSELMTIHEEKLSNFIGLETIKHKQFKDCPVLVKSLGAWGGDFVLSAKFDGYKEYFQQLGFNAIFEYNELVKS